MVEQRMQVAGVEEARVLVSNGELPCTRRKFFAFSMAMATSPRALTVRKSSGVKGASSDPLDQLNHAHRAALDLRGTATTERVLNCVFSSKREAKDGSDRHVGHHLGLAGGERGPGDAFGRIQLDVISARERPCPPSARSRASPSPRPARSSDQLRGLRSLGHLLHGQLENLVDLEGRGEGLGDLIEGSELLNGSLHAPEQITRIHSLSEASANLLDVVQNTST